MAVSVPPFRKARTVRAEIVNSTDSWALLKIPALSAKEVRMCFLCDALCFDDESR